MKLMATMNFINAFVERLRNSLVNRNKVKTVRLNNFSDLNVYLDRRQIDRRTLYPRTEQDRLSNMSLFDRGAQLDHRQSDRK